MTITDPKPILRLDAMEKRTENRLTVALAKGNQRRAFREASLLVEIGRRWDAVIGAVRPYSDFQPRLTACAR